MSLIPEQSNSSSIYPTPPPPQPSPPGPTGDPTAASKDDSRRSNQRLSDSYSASDGDAIWEILSKIFYWFRDLPFISKLLIAGAILFLLLTVLSPITFVVGIIVTAASVVVLVSRVASRRAWGSSSILLLGVVLITLIAGGTSDGIYGTNFMPGFPTGERTTTDTYTDDEDSVSEGYTEEFIGWAEAYNSYLDGRQRGFYIDSVVYGQGTLNIDLFPEGVDPGTAPYVYDLSYVMLVAISAENYASQYDIPLTKVNVWSALDDELIYSHTVDP